MDIQRDAQRTRVSAGLDHSEEVLAEVDEPPDDQGYFGKTVKHTSHAPHPNPFTRAEMLNATRRESLLTRQLNSENEHSNEEDEPVKSPIRGLSTASAWSTHSTTSTAELTSDDGRSIPSPTTSPPLRPTSTQNGLPVTEKPLSKEPRIYGLDSIALQDKPKETKPEEAVEAGLGRRRCITFACGNKGKERPPTPPPSTEEDKPASPPKRKCTIKFACPARAGAENKSSETSTKRRTSPPPPQRRSPQPPKSTSEKAHRGSDSTVTHVSPKNARKASETTSVTAKKDVKPALQRKLSNGSDSGGEGTRFHEFATSDDEPEEWVQESTCWRQRLTVSDTLKKENVIRKLGEEVDEEALLEEDEDDLDDDEDLADEDEDDDEDDDDDDVEVDELDEDEDSDSDDGFHSDNEEGFAVSDSEGEDSENEWWTPAGRSTAATSMDHMDHLTTNPFKADRTGAVASSVGSSSSDGRSPRQSRRKRPHHHKHSTSEAVDIQRPELPDLPDSTDFVCGTLDEDRPLEQAYINRKKEREAAKHKPMPQDIDPTFPTSDPDMDEEDDEDIEDPEESESEAIMHGDMDQIHGDERKPSFTPRRKSHTHRSPPPPTRHRSPAPRRPSPAPRRPSPAPAKRSSRRSPPPRAGSPAPRRPSPAPVRQSTRRSPPPRAGSPAPRRPSPAPVKRSTCRSPPPPVKRGVSDRGPAPSRKLFGQSPQRARSNGYGARMTSPPNTRRTSPSAIGPSIRPMGIGLGARPAPLTHTASLPRTGGFQISRMDRLEAHDIDDAGSDTAGELPLKRRGAIDIVKGLEKKRLRRKEKMLQKQAAKAAAKGEKPYKVKPGKGCERMREVGLEMQRYKGKGEHILSV
ncbi:hypothetical protein WHR41_03404 [Cladosporium halotolerans]|uniref:Extensin domain-containing protein n=1 Tax=Cladosporium halotolerans TaxID=1052096 RepID=A0AB34KVQ2_9PEZI